jgi:hypothetical protein
MQGAGYGHQKEMTHRSISRGQQISSCHGIPERATITPSPGDRRSHTPIERRIEYEPYRANSAVFDDEHTRQNNSRLRLFGKKADKKPKDSKSLYTHKQGSDDSLALMPTLAMGYENSLDKQLKKSAGELRITGDGYYFERVPDDEDNLDYTDESQVMSSDNIEPLQRENKRQQESMDNTGSNNAEQLTPESYEHQGPHSVARDTPYASDIFIGHLETVPDRRIVEPEVRKSGIFKKMFRSDKRSRKKDRIAPIVEPSRITTIEVDREQEVQEDISEALDWGPQLEEHATFVDVLNSIPVVSQIFNQIDESESLSENAKLLIKILLIVWILYEVQTLLETITGLFNSDRL